MLELKQIRKHLNDANNKVRVKAQKVADNKDYNQFLNLIGVRVVK